MNTHINLDKIKGTPIFKALSRLSVLLILFIILAFTTHNFIKASNLSTILLQVAVYAVIAYGVTFVLIVGATDLSAGSVVGLAGIVTALLLRDYNVSPIVAILAGLATGLLCGFINGICVTYLKIMPFIATLGTSWIFRGFCQLIGDGQPVTIRSSANPEAADGHRPIFHGAGGLPDKEQPGLCGCHGQPERRAEPAEGDSEPGGEDGAECKRRTKGDRSALCADDTEIILWRRSRDENRE